MFSIHEKYTNAKFNDMIADSLWCYHNAFQSSDHYNIYYSHNTAIYLPCRTGKHFSGIVAYRHRTLPTNGKGQVIVFSKLFFFWDRIRQENCMTL